MNRRVPAEVPMFSQFGPTIAGLILVGMASGLEGIQQFLTSLVEWRVGLQWYAIALFTAPLVALGVAGIHATVGWSTPQFLPLSELHERYIRNFRTGGWNVHEAKPLPTLGFIRLLGTLAAKRRLGALAVFVLTGICFGALSEEPGWRGYSLRMLLDYHSPLQASLLVAVYWGLWHTGPDFWKLVFQRNPMALAYPVVITIGSVPLSILFTWVYIGSGGSVFLAVLFHASLNMTYTVMSLIWPQVPFQVRYVEFTAGFMVLALAVLLMTQGQLG